MKDSNLASLLIIFGLIVIAGLLFLRMQQADEKLSELDTEHSSLKVSVESERNRVNELERSVMDLERDNSRLETQLEDSETAKDDVAGQLVRLQMDVASTINDLEGFKRDVSESMSWFNANSYLNDSRDAARVKNIIDIQCYRIEHGVCTMKTACFHLINQEMLNIYYQRDVESTGEDDQLSALGEFIDNRGGDCEDYSLFFKAQQNHVISECIEDDVDDIVIETWSPNSGKSNEYIVNFVDDKPWWVTGADIFEIRGHIYPNVVCGNLYDPLLGEVAGHCVIALTSKRIESVDEVFELLDGAPLIESQNGQYLGRINDESSGVYLNSDYDDSYRTSYIWQIITDEDLYRYYRERDNNWVGYHDFKGLLDERILQLRELMMLG